MLLTLQSTLLILLILSLLPSSGFRLSFLGGEGGAGGAENVRDSLTEVTLLLYDAHLWVLLFLFNKSTTHLTHYTIK